MYAGHTWGAQQPRMAHAALLDSTDTGHFSTAQSSKKITLM